jgi:hypothetical protein
LFQLCEVEEDCHGKKLRSTLEAGTETLKNYGTSPLLPGDTVHVALPNEGVDADFRIANIEYTVDARTQTLETVLELGRETPLLADYVFALRSKTDHLSRHKTARIA